MRPVLNVLDCIHSGKMRRVTRLEASRYIHLAPHLFPNHRRDSFRDKARLNLA